MTNEGNTLPRLPTSITPKSAALFCRSAAAVPSAMPRKKEISSDTPPMDSDTGSAAATRSLTDQSA
jgi:hypothetical protein